MKKLLAVLFSLALLFSCGGGGSNDDPANPDGSGAGGIGTDLTKGDMKDAEPMEMTNSEYFSIALEKDTFDNMTMMVGSGEEEIELKYQTKDIKYSKTVWGIASGGAGGEGGDHVWEEYIRPSEVEGKKYNVTVIDNGVKAGNPADITEAEYESGDDSGNGAYMTFEFENWLKAVTDVANSKDKYEYDGATKKYFHSFTADEMTANSIEFDKIWVQFAGNLVKRIVLKFPDSDLERGGWEYTLDFGFYGTTKIAWPK